MLYVAKSFLSTQDRVSYQWQAVVVDSALLMPLSLVCCCCSFSHFLVSASSFSSVGLVAAAAVVVAASSFSSVGFVAAVVVAAAAVVVAVAALAVVAVAVATVVVAAVTVVAVAACIAQGPLRNHLHRSIWDLLKKSCVSASCHFHQEPFLV